MQVVIDSKRLQKIIHAVSVDFPAIDFIFDDGRSRYEDAKVAIGWVDTSLFERMPNLKWVQCDSSGVDWLLKVPKLANGDVLVTNTRGAQADSVSEHGIAMLLHHTRGLQDFSMLQSMHLWTVPDTMKLRSLSELHLGIFGFGAIGKALAKRASALGMRVSAIDPFPSSLDSIVCDELNESNLDTLLRDCDVLAITAPLTKETRHAIGEKELGMMKSDAIILVLSRGGIVDEHSLSRYVADGKFSGVSLDCLENEPPGKDDPIFDMPRTLITPHCSTISSQTQNGIVKIIGTNLTRFLNDESLINVVDKQRGY
jgi:phosphoglycerate dehydrogenase-like enzyme